MFEAWHFWIIVGVLLALAELLGLGFFALALGLACLAGAVMAVLGFSFTGQLLGAGIAAAVIAPLLTRAFRSSHKPRRVSSLAGESRPHSGALVRDSHGQLRVRVEGDLFPVRSLSGRELQEGQTITIRRFDGITALVD